MNSKWILDSGCSHHMIRDHNLLSTLKSKNEGTVTFRNNAKRKIIGIRNVGNPKNPSIENVLLVDGLKHNLISISQLCDIGYKVLFDKKECTIFESTSNQIIFTGNRKHNVYKIKVSYKTNKTISYVAFTNDDAWLWHRRLGHANMGQLSKLSKGDFIHGLPKIDFKKDRLCDACQYGK